MMHKVTIKTLLHAVSRPNSSLDDPVYESWNEGIREVTHSAFNYEICYSGADLVWKDLLYR